MSEGVSTAYSKKSHYLVYKELDTRDHRLILINLRYEYGFKKNSHYICESEPFYTIHLRKYWLKKCDWRWFTRANGGRVNSTILVKFTIMYTLMLMALMKITFAYSSFKRVFRNMSSFEPHTLWAQYCRYSHYPCFCHEGAETQENSEISLWFYDINT